MKNSNGLITPDAQDVQFRGTAYTLIPNKNGGLCDIRPLDDVSYQILSHKRGGDVRLVKAFLEDLSYVEQHDW